MEQRELRSWSLDLIQAVPAVAGASAPPDLAAWQAQLQQAIASGAPHLSVYELTLEPGTVFGRRSQRGQLQLPDDDLAADQLELTSASLGAAGYGRYEVSNYALPGHASRHNRVYWSGADWWAFGLGATSCVGGQRLARPRTREAYAAWVQELEAHPHATGTPSRLPLDERLLVGLRRREGVVLASLLDQAGLSQKPSLLGALAQRLQHERDAGLLLLEGNRWRLSDPAGLGLSNAVLRSLLRALGPAGSEPTAAGPQAPAP
jgi:oxygen-independent coproporphyrinogen-3 oxidase